MRHHTPSSEHVGEVFARLRVLSVKLHNGRSWALCRCECGRHTRTQVQNLLTGATRSCGCITVERMTAIGRAAGYVNRKGNRARFIDGLKRDVILARAMGDDARAREVERVLESMGAEVPA